MNAKEARNIYECSRNHLYDKAVVVFDGHRSEIAFRAGQGKRRVKISVPDDYLNSSQSKELAERTLIDVFRANGYTVKRNKTTGVLYAHF